MEIITFFYWTFSVLLVGFQLVSIFYLQFGSTSLDFHSICQKLDCTEAPKQAIALKKNLSFTREKPGCGKGDPPADGQMGKGEVEGTRAEEDAYTLAILMMQSKTKQISCGHRERWINEGKVVFYDLDTKALKT